MATTARHTVCKTMHAERSKHIETGTLKHDEQNMVTGSFRTFYQM